MCWNRSNFFFRGCQFFLSLSLCFSTYQLAWSEPVGQDARIAAQRLAETGIRFELDGEPQYAQYAWQAALNKDPNCELARWRLGYVLRGDDWILAASHPTLERKNQVDSYARRRHRALDESHRELQPAIWCRNQGLPDRSEVHFRRVFDNTEAPAQTRQFARNALNLREFGGVFLTPAQITELRSQMREARTELNTWSRKLSEPVRMVRSQVPGKQKRGWKQLQQINHPEAIPALELHLSTVDEEIAQGAVDIIQQISGPAASESLVRHAVISPWPSVREAALLQLEERPLQDFIPMLLGALQMPIRSVFQISPGIGGRILHEHTFQQEGIDETRLVRMSTTAVPNQFGERDDAQAEINRAEQRAQRIQSNVMRTNVQNQQQNHRIFQVLYATTGQKLPSNPNDWWEWWKDYNEYEILTNKPVQTANFSHRYTYGTAPVVTRRQTRRRRIESSECFPAGTPVWTELGKRAIESIRVGDRVLSQNPETGELNYKLVTAVTERNQAPMQTITVGDQSLRLTTGHPLWVNGEGWRMAKLLNLGSRVHCIGGSQTVTRTEKSPRETAYNLIVQGFGSYFVTDLGILVHDNTYRSPNRALSPGLLANQ